MYVVPYFVRKVIYLACLSIDLYIEWSTCTQCSGFARQDKALLTYSMCRHDRNLHLNLNLYPIADKCVSENVGLFLYFAM